MLTTKQRNGAATRRLNGWAVIAAALVALALLLAGCSADSGSQKDAAPAPAAAENADMLQDAAGSQQNAAGSQQEAKASSQVSVTSTSAAAQDKNDADPAVQAGTGFVPIADPETGMNRKVIYKAQVTMKVPKFDTAEEKLRDAIHQSGAYVLQFNNTQNLGEKGAEYVIKVPADGFSSFIERLRKIQKEMQLLMQGSDVTEEYVDLTARLGAKKVVEARLLAFMDKAAKTDDLVKFSSELAKVQEEIEQLKGRIRYLDQNVAFSTVNLRLYEGIPDNAEIQSEHTDTFGDRLIGAITGSAKVLGQFGEALLLFLAALLPVAAVTAVVGIPVFLIVRANRTHQRQAAAERRKQMNAAPAPKMQNPAADPEETPEDDIR